MARIIYALLKIEIIYKYQKHAILQKKVIRYRPDIKVSRPNTDMDINIESSIYRLKPVPIDSKFKHTTIIMFVQFGAYLSTP